MSGRKQSSDEDNFAMMLMMVKGTSFKEIARHFGISRQAVYQRMVRYYWKEYSLITRRK